MGQHPLSDTNEETNSDNNFFLKNYEENQNIHNLEDLSDINNNFVYKYKEISISDCVLGKRTEHKSEDKENEQEIENYEQKNYIEEKNYNQMKNKIENEEAFRIEDELHQKTKKRKHKKNEEYRLEEFLKIILTVCFNYILSETRKKIKKCKKIYNKTILLHVTNCKKYQGNPTKSNIKRIFQKTVKSAFCDFDKNCFEGITLQRSNKNFIDQIYKREDFPSNEEEIELKQYLEMKIADLIKKFYDDEPDELINLRENYHNWDEIFFNEKKKKKGFYLLQKYGIIQYAEMPDPLFKNLVDKGRLLLKECKLKDFQEFNGIKLLFVSPDKYPKDRDVRNNPNLLQKKVKDVLMDEKYDNLKKNKKIIEIFYFLINEKKTLTKEQSKLKLFLEMSIQEYINNNYRDSDIIKL